MCFKNWVPHETAVKKDSMSCSLTVSYEDDGEEAFEGVEDGEGNQAAEPEPCFHERC